MNWWWLFNLEKDAALEKYDVYGKKLHERSSGSDGSGNSGSDENLERSGYSDSDRVDTFGNQEAGSSNPMEYGGSGSSGGGVVQDTSGVQASSSVSDEGIVSLIGPTGLAVACACAAAGIFICLGAFLWFKSRRRRQKLLRELTFDSYEDGGMTKSAPSSRCPSPRGSKRMSCPDAFSDSRSSSKSGTVLVKSWTCDPILDSTLPPECVQPKLVTENNPPSYQCMYEDTAEKTRPSLTSSLSARGRIWFSTFYDVMTQQLNVNLIKVKDLPKRESTNEEPDPFVKMYLLPDEKTCQVSKSKKKTHCPIYNELHRFQVPAYEVKDRVLRFSVYDVDKRRVRRSLGHIVINLNNLDLDKGDVMCSELERSVQTNTALGDVQLSLAYIPQKEKVKIGIHKARKLLLDKEHLDKGAYVRIQLFYGHKCHRVKRTVTRQIKEDCPFEESLAFTVQGRQLESCSLVISVMITHPHEFSKNDVEYGRVVIGPFMYARGQELAHWQQMVAKPKHITTHWHSLVSPS